MATKDVSPQTISHAVTTENHFFRVKCDHVQGKFAYAINMYCEIVLNSSYIETDLPSFLPQSKLWPSYIESGC